MKLRSQMLLAGALTLFIPVVGWHSVKQLYAALQQTRIDEQTLKVANMRLALSESATIRSWLEPALQPPSMHDWYAEHSPFQMFLDGYDDDWRTLVNPWYVYSSSHNESGNHVERVAFDERATNDPVGIRTDVTHTSDGNTVSLRVASENQQLHLFIRVQDTQVIYHRPPRLRPDAGEGESPDRWQQLVNGDSVEVLIEQSEGDVVHGLFRAMAPGALTGLTGSDGHGGQRAGRSLPAWQGFWAGTEGGYQLEITMPLPANGAKAGIAIVDVDEPMGSRTRWLGSVSPDTMRAAGVNRTQDTTATVATNSAQDTTAAAVSNGAQDTNHARVFHASNRVRDRLEGWVTQGIRARLFDARGWLVADVNKLYTTVEDDLADEQAGSFDGVLDALLFRIFSVLVADDLPLLPVRQQTSVALNLNEARRASVAENVPVTSRYVTDENDRVLGTLAPLGQDPQRAYLLIEANEEHASAYAGSQLARLFSLLLLVSVLAGCGLLIFAMVLSSRIRQLSYQAQEAVSVDGRVTGLKGSEAQDEIGDLSRKLSTLLSRSAQYTQYLEALSSRLSHELRTPLSVVRTSLENLDMQSLDAESETLVRRATGGADRLSRIIKALIDSTRLEQSVQGATPEDVDLDRWLAACAVTYQQIHPELSFVVHPEPGEKRVVQVSPDLLQQAMDKLVDNACSFSEDGAIMLQLTVDQNSPAPYVMLGVANRGAAIDESTAAQFFDPLVSYRDSNDDDLHLGLGLYLVRLIAEGSGGHAFARNQSGWVVFGLSLPLS